MNEKMAGDAYAPFDVRDDILRAHRHIWEHLARPGTWLAGAERVAVAAETRAARVCALCRQRQSALSSYAVAGAHDAATALDPARMDAVHRITTDPGRLSRRILDDLAEAGDDDAAYVELLSVVVFTLALDTFRRALGLDPLPLPQPEPGEPAGERPAQLEDIGAWVPVLSTRSPGARDLFAGVVHASNIIRALSLVPAATRDQLVLTRALYLPPAHIPSTGAGGRALSRPQIELIASRVSALNQCFY